MHVGQPYCSNEFILYNNLLISRLADNFGFQAFEGAHHILGT